MLLVGAGSQAQPAAGSGAGVRAKRVAQVIGLRKGIDRAHTGLLRRLLNPLLGCYHLSSQPGHGQKGSTGKNQQ